MQLIARKYVLHSSFVNNALFCVTTITPIILSNHILPSSCSLGVAHCNDHILGFSMGKLSSRVSHDLFFVQSRDSFRWNR